MSTPSPANNITLPDTKSYLVKIDSDAYKNSGPTILSFLAGLDDKWTAFYNVHNQDDKLILEKSIEVTAPTVMEYTFEFELHDPNEQQQEAGYIEGKYVFTFSPPGSDPAEFGGMLNDPRNGDAVDNWNATGVDPDKKGEDDETGEY